MNFKNFKDKYQKIEPEHFPHSVSENPIVSICIQTFNHENYIKKCLDSVLTQNLGLSYEILLGEDNSNDKTREICIDYALKHPDKIRLFLHCTDNKIKVNSISTGNFNALYNFYQARGKFIAFCEGDDYWTDKEKLKKQIRLLEKKKDIVLCYHSYLESYEEEVQNKIKLNQPSWDISQNDLQRVKYHPQLSTVCFRNPFKEIPREMAEVVNVDSFLLSLLGHYGIAKFDSTIQPNIYRKHNNGIWTGEMKEKKYLLKISTYQKLAEYYEKLNNNVLATYFKLMQHNILKSLFKYYLTSKPLKAIPLISEIFRFKST